MKFVFLINLKLLTILNSFLLNIAEHENFSANKYENANFSWVEHEKSFITSRPDSLFAIDSMVIGYRVVLYYRLD